MSFYDDAKFMFLAGGAAGKDGKAYSVKPVEELSSTDLVINGDFSIDGPLANGELGTGYGSYGWNTIATNEAANQQEGTSTIANGVLTLTNGAGDVDARAYVTDGVSTRNVVTTNTYYRLRYRVVENTDCTIFKVYHQGGQFVEAPGTVGEHTLIIRNTTNQLFLFTNSTESSSISIDNVSLREITTEAADFTFSRGTDLTATRVGKDGYIEKGRENLLLQSNQFDTTWTDPNADVTSGYAGRDGSNDAWELSLTGTFGQTAQDVSASGISGVNTLSFYAKSGTSDFTRPYIAGPNKYAYFDLLNGQTGAQTGVASSIEDAGNGWWRCSFTVEGSITEVRLHVADSISTIGTSTSGTIYIQDAQLEQGLSASDYIETGATTARAGVLEDEPRFDYTGGGCPSLLIEEERKNYIVHSEHFGASEWAVPSATKNSTFTYMPDEVTPAGLKGVWKYTADTSNDQLGIVPSGALSVGDVVTNSIFVKRAGGQSTITISFRDINNDVASTHTLTDADGWKRITATGTCDGTPSIARRHYLNLGTANDAILVWGAQQEDGPVATSYIPTYGAAATRTQDQPEELEHGITMGTSCSIFFEGKHAAPNVGAQVSMFRLRIGNDSENRFLIYGSGGGATTFPLVVQHKVSGTAVNTTSKTLNINESFKVLARIDGTTMDVFINGELHDTKTIPATDIYDKISLYRTPAADQSGHAVKQAILFDSALSTNDSEIITGTSYSTFGQMASELSYTEYE